LRRRDLVLISDIEHSSNDLPWRQWATLKRFRTGFDNTVDLESLATALDRHGKNVKLVAISGASNVTGYITPISDVATIAHSFGVPIFVDCAQLAPHRKISMGSATDDGRIDFVAFSGHKMGAPYGTGVLICPSGLVASSEIPSDEPGGGTADLVTDNRVFWSDSPERHEAGTPNAVGVIALAKAIEVLESLGFDNIQEHEKNLWVKACAGLARIKGVELYVNPTNASRHTPVLPFNLEGMHHGIVAAILGFEYAIGVRHGRHCADNLVMRLTGFPKHRREDLIKEAIQGGKTTQVYGIVRPSIGISNTDEDIERLLDAVGRIAQDGTKIEYEPEIRRTKSCALSRETGEFIPRGMDVRALIGLGIDQNRGHFEPIHANYD
jgi:selenocysteine lyase/cysteine desulfurase